MMLKLLLTTLFISHSLLSYANCVGNNRNTTTGSQFEDIENVFTSPELISIRNEYCRTHENQFRTFALERLRQRVSLWTEHRNNPDVLRTIEEHLREAHEQIRQEHVDHANDWINSLSAGTEQDFAKNCFVDRENHQSQPYPIHFDGHFRTLQTRNDLDPTICIGIRASFERYLIQNVNIEDSGVEFRRSPFGQMMDQSVLFGANFTDEDYQRIIPQQIDRGIAQMGNVSEYLEGLPDRALYELYDFQNLYENEFLPTLPEIESNNFHPTCREQSSWGASCIDNPLVAGVDVDRGRCLSRTLNFLGENLPLVGMIDGFFQVERTASAHRGGLLTDLESSNLQSDHAVQILFGIPITVGSGAIIRGTASEVATISGRVIPLEDLLSTQARRTVTLRRATTPDGNPTQLRFDIDRESITHIRNHDFTPRDIDRIFSERLTEIRDVLNANPADRRAENLIRNILTRPLPDGRPSPFRTGSNPLSVYPEGLGLEDVLPDIQRGRVVQIQAGNSVINRVTIDGRQYSFRIDRNGTLENFVPHCGPGVTTLPRSQDIINYIIQNREPISSSPVGMEISDLLIPHSTCN